MAEPYPADLLYESKEDLVEGESKDPYGITHGAGAGFGSCISDQTSSDAALAAALADHNQEELELAISIERTIAAFEQVPDEKLARDLAAEQDAELAARMAAQEEQNRKDAKLAARLAAEQHA